jgi:hypothetical protein
MAIRGKSSSRSSMSAKFSRSRMFSMRRQRKRSAFSGLASRRGV